MTGSIKHETRADAVLVDKICESNNGTTIGLKRQNYVIRVMVS
jgi:hypothetical protein